VPAKKAGDAKRKDKGGDAGKDRKDKRAKTEEGGRRSAGGSTTSCQAEAHAVRRVWLQPLVAAVSAASAAAQTPAASATPAAEPDDEPDVNPIPEQEVTVLRGHEAEVFICAWNPQQPLLASAYVAGASRR